MRRLRSPELAGFLRTFAVVGAAALGIWLAVGVGGIAAGAFAPTFEAYGPALRFLVAILTLTAPLAVRTEVHRFRLRRIPPDQRYGFAAGD